MSRHLQQQRQRSDFRPFLSFRHVSTFPPILSASPLFSKSFTDSRYMKSEAGQNDMARKRFHCRRGYLKMEGPLTDSKQPASDCPASVSGRRPTFQCSVNGSTPRPAIVSVSGKLMESHPIRETSEINQKATLWEILHDDVIGDGAESSRSFQKIVDARLKLSISSITSGCCECRSRHSIVDINNSASSATASPTGHFGLSIGVPFRRSSGSSVTGHSGTTSSTVIV